MPLCNLLQNILVFFPNITGTILYLRNSKYPYIMRFHITYYIHLIITSCKINLIHCHMLTQYLHIDSAFLVIFLILKLIKFNMPLLYQTKQLKKISTHISHCIYLFHKYWLLGVLNCVPNIQLKAYEELLPLSVLATDWFGSLATARWLYKLW